MVEKFNQIMTQLMYTYIFIKTKLPLVEDFYNYVYNKRRSWHMPLLFTKVWHPKALHSKLMGVVLYFI